MPRRNQGFPLCLEPWLTLQSDYSMSYVGQTSSSSQSFLRKFPSPRTRTSFLVYGEQLTKAGLQVCKRHKWIKIWVPSAPEASARAWGPEAATCGRQATLPHLSLVELVRVLPENDSTPYLLGGIHSCLSSVFLLTVGHLCSESSVLHPFGSAQKPNKSHSSSALLFAVGSLAGLPPCLLQPWCCLIRQVW